MRVVQGIAGAAAGLLAAGWLVTWAAPAEGQASQVTSRGGGGGGALAPEAAAGEVRTQNDFWRQVTQPRFARSRTLLRHARKLLSDHERPGIAFGLAQRRALLEGAIHRLELAHRITPRDPEVLFLLARAKSSWQRYDPATGRVARLDDEAIELFERLRAIDPDYEAQQVAFELGVLHTRAHAFARAADEYQRAIALELMTDSSPTAYANLAEVTMLAGDVQEALSHYERAVEITRRLGGSAELPLWGMAVALDRLGEHRAALERAGEALRAGDSHMGILRSDHVFFEPQYELHWYEALGHEALAETQEDAEAREAELRQALASWRAYLSEGGRQGPWADLAEERSDALTERLEPSR